MLCATSAEVLRELGTSLEKLVHVLDACFPIQSCQLAY
jgi:hypothetical protein